MNKLAPNERTGGKGSKDDDKFTRLGQEKKGKRDPKRDAAIIARALKRFNNAAEWESDNRKAALEDLKFYAGDQWPAEVIAQRTFDRRPCLTINRLPTLVHQVTNDQKMNRPAINVSPVGDRGDPEVAKMDRGLIRAIERDSDADFAYDTGFDMACRMGWGYWRLRTSYESPESVDEQVIVIEPIANPFAVYLDPEHQRPDGADAKWGFISAMMIRSDFEDDYPGADPCSWSPTGIGDMMKAWIEKDKIRIAEYYEFENEKRMRLRLSNNATVWEDDLPDETWSLINNNTLEIIAEREVDYPKLKWYKLTAREILDEKDQIGQWVPIVKCTGDWVNIEGKPKINGIVRNAKDPQRMFNYWRTSLTEKVALAPKAKYLVGEGQIEDYVGEWQTAHTSARPFLTYKPTSLEGHPVPPPIRISPEAIEQGLVGAANDASQDLLATTGIRFDATLNERQYDESGRALRELRRAGDIGSYHYTDNFARSLRHTGEILLDWIPKVYDTKRILTILREDDTEERVEIDPNAPKAQSERRDTAGKVLRVFNPTIGRYGVTVTVGPSYATKRIEAAESMMDFARAMPAAGQLIMDLIAKNQDWPGAEEMATRLAKALPPGLLTPEMKDVPPQVQALLGQMQQQLQQMQVEKTAMMKQLTDQNAERAIQVDKIEKDFEAKLLAIVAKIEIEAQKAAAKAVESHNSTVMDAIREVARGVEMLTKPQERTNA